MSTDFGFPLALCKAQWGIWLHALEMLGTSGAQCMALGSHAMLDSVEQTRAEADAVTQAEDWQALAMAPMNSFWHAAASHASTALALCPAGAAADAPPRDRNAAQPAADAMPRRAVVAGALYNLNTALAGAPSRKKT